MNPLQSIPFVKASACGNDFLIVSGRGIFDFAELTRRLCDRHNGVGADGVEWTFSAENGELGSAADVSIRLFNADGTEAEISGNGTRCVAAEWIARHDATTVRVRTAAGTKVCKLVERSRNDFKFESEMGVPKIGAEFSVSTAYGEFPGILVSMGNPHFVIVVKEFSDHWQAEAAAIQQQSAFPRGVNVEFVRILNEAEIEIRLYERGVGETQSSGTGSCAAAVAAISKNLCQSPVVVHAPGGSQTVRWKDRVFLTGPARLICSGEFFV